MIPGTNSKRERTNPDDVQNRIHYEFAFNKENIAMIKELASNNRNCKFYVWDKDTNKVRVCDSFKEWAEKPFSELIVGKGKPQSQGQG